MGNSNSNPIAPLLEYHPVRNRSIKHSITEWDDSGSKNYAYYTGERMCVIPPALYPQEQTKTFFNFFY